MNLLQLMIPLKELSLLLVILLQTVYSIEVGIHRVPDQPIQLSSGGSVVLICTVTTPSPNTTVMIEWFNSSQSLQQVTNSIYITQPYQLGNYLWQSGLDLRILTIDHSGSYRCQATDGSNQVTAFYYINVEDSSTQTVASVVSHQGTLYSLIPFFVNSTLQLPLHISPQVRVKWYRNDVMINELNSYNINTVHVNSTHVTSNLLVTEPTIATAIRYTCIFTAELYGIEIFTLNRSTALRNIASYPRQSISISTLPINGPTVDAHYSVTCSVMKSVNGTLTVSWRKNGLLVKSVGNIKMGQLITTATGTSLTMTFEYNINTINEGTYICTASLSMEDYNVVLSNSAEITITAPGRVLNVQVLDLSLLNKQVLTCTVETSKAVNNVSIRWEDDYGPVSTGTHNLTELTPTVYQSLLEIYRPQIYYCDAYINGSLQRSHWYYVNALNTFNVSSISVTILKSSLMIPSVGDEYSLNCTSGRTDQSLTITIEWRRANGAELQSDDSHTVSSLMTNSTHVTSVLIFHSLQISDVGQYMCLVTHESIRNNQGSARVDLQIRAPTPKIIVIPVSKERVTCSIESNSTTDDLTINVNWFFQLKGHHNTVGIDQEKNRLKVSVLNTEECGQVYSQHIDLLEDTKLLSIYSNITCQVTVNGSVSSIISSVSSASITNTTRIPSYTLPPPSSPYNVTVTNIGSNWIILKWNSNDSSSQFEIQYLATSNKLTQYTTSFYHDSTNLYTALLTNLQPGTQYSVLVVATNEAGMNQSQPIEFTTNETMPTGSPTNLSYQVLSDGSYLFTWLPPDNNKRNGLINGYQFECNPPLTTQSSYTTTTNISVTILILDTNYTCSVAALNKAGVGPSTTIAFSTYRPKDIGGVSEVNSNSQSSSLNTYLLIPVNALLMLTVVIIVVLTVATCYYKRKYTEHSFDVSNGSTLTSSLSPTLSLSSAPPPRKPSQRYVSTDTVEFLWQQRQMVNSPNYTDCTRGDLALTRQESLV